MADSADEWQGAKDAVFPCLLPPGSQGDPAERKVDWANEGIQTHAQPLITEGPCGLVVAFTLQGPGFDVLVNAQHLHDWGITAEELAVTAGQNLGSWSDGVGWTDEDSGERRLRSSESGTGRDAARILLPAVRAGLAAELRRGAPPGTRVLVGLPDRELLVAGALRPGDAEFAGLFHDFVMDHSASADQPIDRRLFELQGDDLVEFTG
ncbi:MAG TPA: hypothetical protein VMH24_03035 [Candidatus Sulfotelmatobacter sp.]|nr:hypothetical protein [Candidatus Sulfotelmatobacter sp.]